MRLDILNDSAVVLTDVADGVVDVLKKFWSIRVQSSKTSTRLYLPIKAAWALPSYYPSMEVSGAVLSWKERQRRPESIDLLPSLGDHQRRAILRAIREKRLGIAAEAGGGKTLIALEIARFFSRTLILVPPGIADGYVEDFREFYSGIRFNLVSVYQESVRDRAEFLGRPGHVYIQSPHTLQGNLADILEKPWACIIVDESTRFKNPDSRFAKTLLNEVAPRIPHRYILTADPKPNTAGDIWAQAKFLDPNVFGTYNAFATEFGSKGRWGFTFDDPAKVEKCLERASSVFEVISEDEFWPNRPKHIMTRVSVKLEGEQKAQYDSLLANSRMRFEGREDIKIKTAMEQVMKLRQLTGGACYDNSHRRKPVQFGVAKIAPLKDIIRNHLDSQIVIWRHFQYEDDLLAYWLTRWNLSYGIYNGRSAESLQARYNFRRGRLKVLVTNAATAGHGVRFDNANVAVYYTLDRNPDTHYQSTRRLYRKPQTKDVYTYFLLAKGTIDEEILNHLEGKITERELLYNVLGVKVNEA